MKTSSGNSGLFTQLAICYGLGDFTNADQEASGDEVCAPFTLPSGECARFEFARGDMQLLAERGISRLELARKIPLSIVTGDGDGDKYRLINFTNAGVAALFEAIDATTVRMKVAVHH